MSQLHNISNQFYKNASIRDVGVQARKFCSENYCIEIQTTQKRRYKEYSFSDQLSEVLKMPKFMQTVKQN